jgi:Sideroflexins
MDLDKPLFDQTTFIGRLKHFFWVTDPRTCVCSEDTLDNAKKLLTEYRYITAFCLSHYDFIDDCFDL